MAVTSGIHSGSCCLCRKGCKMYRDMEKTRKEEFLSSEWTPPVDIFESGNAFVLKLEVPEVDKDTIDIKIHENELTIKGERKLEPGVHPDNYYRMERGTACLPGLLPSPNR